MTTVYSPDRLRGIIERSRDDFAALAYDGFGIMLSDQQIEARDQIGVPGPREHPDDPKFYWLSGGQRSGKTVLAFLCHADACLYKRGVDPTDRLFWRNYQYGTLAIAPTDALTLRLWQIGDEVSKGSNDAQYDRKARHARGGAFIDRFKAGKDSKGNGLWTFQNGSRTEFRSSEGWAYRLEGGQWWWITWDEWASQPDREVHTIRTDVLMGRARDHDAKIMPMAWPKPETEHHLIAVMREIEAGRDRDSRVIFLEADRAFFTNQEALEVELRNKTAAQILRTIKGRPGGGASKEFKPAVVDNMVNVALPRNVLPDFEWFAYFDAWDLGLGSDSTCGLTFRIPIVGGKKVVTPDHKARIVADEELPGTDTRTIGDITDAIRKRNLIYRGPLAADATGMGGLMAVRELRDMKPRPTEFKSRSNDRLWGNMRLAAITNALDCLSWGYDEAHPELPWGLVESPRIVPLLDQMANFDRDAKHVADDWVWTLIIALWYIRRWWAIGNPNIHGQVPFNIAESEAAPQIRKARDLRRSRLIGSGIVEAPRTQVIYRPEGLYRPGGVERRGGR